MERLTKWDGKHASHWDCHGSCENCDGCCGYCASMVDRLAAIEDILGDEYDLERLRELVQANREGRCVVLPVEVGQNVYFINRAFDSEICVAIVIGAEINLYTPSCPIWLRIEWFSKRVGKHEYYSRADLMIGKTVFLTRAEAEAALRREQDG